MPSRRSELVAGLASASPAYWIVYKAQGLSQRAGKKLNAIRGDLEQERDLILSANLPAR